MERVVHWFHYLVSVLDLPLLASLAVALLFATWGFTVAWSGRRRWAPVIAACGLLLAQVALYLPDTVDDSFITFRYARNWAQGLGPVYEAGVRVEGFTSFLWTALLALSVRLGADIEWASKGLGVACALATLVGVSRLARVMAPEGRAAGFAPLLLAMSPLFAAWSVAGMEAPLFAMILAWAAVWFAEEARQPDALPRSAVMFGVLVLARPEGGLFAMIAAAVSALGRRDPGTPRRIARWLATFAAIALPYWVARWAWFGDFFPNTFYAKTGHAGAIVDNIVLLSDFLADSGSLLVFLALTGAWTADRESRGARFGLISIAAFFAYVLVVGDILRLRFFVHILPLWITIAALGLDRASIALASSPSDRKRSRLAALRSPMVLLAVLWMLVVYRQIGRVLERREGIGAAYVVDVADTMREAHIPLGHFLHEHAPRGARVAATDIGAVAYFSELPTLDLFGLTDRPVAHLRHRRVGAPAIAAHVLSRRPELMVLYGSSKGPRLQWFESHAAEFDSAYRVHSYWQDSREDKGLVLMVRRDVLLPPASPPGDRFRR